MAGVFKARSPDAWTGGASRARASKKPKGATAHKTARNINSARAEPGAARANAHINRGSTARQGPHARATPAGLPKWAAAGVEQRERGQRNQQVK